MTPSAPAPERAVRLAIRILLSEMMARKEEDAKTSRIGNPGLLLIRAQSDQLRTLRTLMRNNAKDEDVAHQVRIGIKSLRAGWRLLRSDIPASVFLGENRRLRKSARGLSAVREQAVLARTLAKLGKRAPGDGEPRLISHALKTYLARHPRDGKDRGKSGTEKPMPAAPPVLSGSLDRMEAFASAQWGWNRARPSLVRSYRKARGKYRDADPDRDDSFHEWRKRVKDLWYQIKALSPGLPAAQKILKRLDALQEALGDAHDLMVLEARITRRPRDFGVAGNPAALRKPIDAENRKLKRKSIRLGRRIFGYKPEKFIRKLNLPD